MDRKRWDSVAPDDNLRGVPEIVIEVLSPSNTLSEMNEKRKVRLENGGLQFWVVDADHFQINVSTPEGITTTYRRGQSIPLPLFGGAEISVDKIFQGIS